MCFFLRIKLSDDQSISLQTSREMKRYNKTICESPSLLRKCAPRKLRCVCSTVELRVQLPSTFPDDHDYIHFNSEEKTTVTCRHQSSVGYSENCKEVVTSMLVRAETIETPRGRMKIKTGLTAKMVQERYKNYFDESIQI